MKRLILFFITGPGAILVILLAIFGVCYYVGKGQAAKQAAEIAKVTQRDIGQVVPATDASTSAPKEKVLLDRNLTPVNQSPTQISNGTVLPQGLALAAFYEDVAAPSPTPAPTPPPAQYWLPPSIFIPCILVNTVESSHINTPVVGEVSRDCYQNGHLIIPAGTIVSSFAENGAVRDRIEVAGTWLFVFSDGRHLKVPGIACDREADPTNQQFGTEDGSAGLRGKLVESDHWANAKAFIALLMTSATQAGTAAVSGAISHGTGAGVGVGLPDTTPIMAKYLDQLLNGETGDGRFVQVPASTEFYIFPTDTILPSHRSVVTTQEPVIAQPPVPVDPSAKAALDMERQILQQPTPNENPKFKY